MLVSNTQGEVQLAPSVRYWLLNYNIVAAPGDPQGIAEMLAGTVPRKFRRRRHYARMTCLIYIRRTLERLSA